MPTNEKNLFRFDTFVLEDILSDLDIEFEGDYT